VKRALIKNGGRQGTWLGTREGEGSGKKTAAGRKEKVEEGEKKSENLGMSQSPQGKRMCENENWRTVDLFEVRLFWPGPEEHGLAV